MIRLRGLPLMPPPKATKPSRGGEVAAGANPNEGMLQAIKETPLGGIITGWISRKG